MGTMQEGGAQSAGDSGRRLVRRSRQIRPVVADYEVRGAFVPGGGLDFHDADRYLPFVAVLEADEMAAGPS
jgi:hypothetical protein